MAIQASRSFSSVLLYLKAVKGSIVRAARCFTSGFSFVQAFLNAHAGPRKARGDSFHHVIVSPLVSHFGWGPLGDDVIRAAERTVNPSSLAHCFRFLLDISHPTISFERAQENVPNKKIVSQERLDDFFLDRKETRTRNEWDARSGCRAAVEAVVGKIVSEGSARDLPYYHDEYKDWGQGLKDAKTINDLLLVVQRFGWATWSQAARALAGKRACASRDAAIALFLDVSVSRSSLRSPIPSSEDFKSFYLCFAEELFWGIKSEGDALYAAGYRHSWDPDHKLPDPRRSPDLVCNLLKEFHALDCGHQLRYLVPHFFETPRLHDLETTLQPTLEPLCYWLGGPESAKQTPLVRGLMPRVLARARGALRQAIRAAQLGDAGRVRLRLPGVQTARRLLPCERPCTTPHGRLTG